MPGEMLTCYINARKWSDCMKTDLLHFLKLKTTGDASTSGNRNSFTSKLKLWAAPNRPDLRKPAVLQVETCQAAATSYAPLYNPGLFLPRTVNAVWVPVFRAQGPSPQSTPPTHAPPREMIPNLGFDFGFLQFRPLRWCKSN